MWTLSLIVDDDANNDMDISRELALTLAVLLKFGIVAGTGIIT